MDHPEAKPVRRDRCALRGVVRPGTPLVLVVVVVTAFWHEATLPAAAQADPLTTDTTATHSLTEPHSPKKALRRAIIVPGWGQYYNRHYLKIPLVYAGLGGFTAAALYVNSRYLLYRHAYLFTAREEDGEPVFPEYADDYARLIEDLGLPPESELSDEEIESRRARLEPQFRANRDNFRRNRDLLYFGIVFWYGLSLLDAYVSAHLLDFDIGEDLTVSLYPHPSASGLTATMRWGF